MKDRQAQLKALLSRGHASAQELLELDFGQWPPPGIPQGAASLPEIPIVFKKLRTSAKNSDEIDAGASFCRLSYSDLANYEVEEHVVVLEETFSDYAEVDGNLLPPRNRRNVETDLTVLGHEAVHVLQWVAFSLDRFLQPDLQAETVGQSVQHGHGAELDAILASEETDSQTAERETTLLDNQHNIGAVPRLYYLSHIEIQARLHQLAVAACAAGEWKELPRTREALRTALEPALRGDDSRNAWKTENNPDAHAALSELREHVLGVLSPKQQEAFFRDALPSIYGSLLELYGDSEGRRSMGFPPNPVHARAMAAQIFAEEIETGGPAWPKERWTATARRTEPEARERLLALADYYKRTDVLDALTGPKKNRKGPQIEGLFSRLTLENVDFTASYKNRLPTHDSTGQPLDISGLIAAWTKKR
ncbi:MAG: hypothetical protein PW734_11765 [Verrucomicrobium sp.]|nr:hypothetical protein [Verrucomicrobium sp.]